MSKLDDLQNKIKQQSVGATGRRVLLVEGPDDEQAFRAWLGKVSVSWENQWVIAIAEKKSNVLGLLEREANWIGVVDQVRVAAVGVDHQRAVSGEQCYATGAHRGVAAAS